MLEIWGRKNSSNVAPVMWTIGELGLEHTIVIASSLSSQVI